MSVNTKFQIRLIGGASFLFAEAMSIDIWDVDNNVLCCYELRGLAWSKGLPLALNFRGPWNDIHVLTAMRCDDFGGGAIFSTIFKTGESINVLSLRPINHPPVDVIPFRTGVTLGCGFATGAGVLRRLFPPIPADEASWPHDVPPVGKRAVPLLPSVPKIR